MTLRTFSANSREVPVVLAEQGSRGLGLGGAGVEPQSMAPRPGLSERMLPIPSFSSGIGRSRNPVGELCPGVHRAGENAREDQQTFSSAGAEPRDLVEI